MAVNVKISLKEIAQNIVDKDNVYVLCHQYPDGDTIGSAVALCLAFLQKGKKAKLICCDEIPTKYSYITDCLANENFDPEFIIAVDIADEKLLGSLQYYDKKINLCIDHHKKNTNYAKISFVDSNAASTAEIIYKLIKLMDINITPSMAECLYTGITTDTGCFKYANATYETYIIAAEMIKCGARAAMINKIMFDTKTIEKMKLEKLILDTLELYFNNLCATICLTKAMIEESKASINDLDGIASIPRGIAGVLVGITLREKDNGEFKISLRTEDPIDAYKICSSFGGGGHKNAAGCSMHGSINEIMQKILKRVKEELTLLK